MTRHPILAALTPAIITTLIAAVVNLLNVFNVITITPEQLEAVNALALSLLVLLGGGGLAYGQSKVTPVADPRLPTGTDVTVTGVTPDGQPDPVVTV